MRGIRHLRRERLFTLPRPKFLMRGLALTFLAFYTSLACYTSES